MCHQDFTPQITKLGINVHRVSRHFKILMFSDSRVSRHINILRSRVSTSRVSRHINNLRFWVSRISRHVKILRSWVFWVSRQKRQHKLQNPSRSQTLDSANAGSRICLGPWHKSGSTYSGQCTHHCNHESHRWFVPLVLATVLEPPRWSTAQHETC